MSRALQRCFFPFTFAGGSMKRAVLKPSSACGGEKHVKSQVICSGPTLLLIAVLAFAHQY